MNDVQLDLILEAINRLGTGTVNHPGVLEAISMGLNGCPANKENITTALYSIAYSISDLAEAIREMKQ